MSTSLKCHKVVQAAAQPSKGHQQQPPPTTTRTDIPAATTTTTTAAAKWMETLAKMCKNFANFRYISHPFPCLFFGDASFRQTAADAPNHSSHLPHKPTSHNLRQRNDKASCKNYFPLRDTRTNSTKRVREKFMKISFGWENTCAAFFHFLLPPPTSLSLPSPVRFYGQWLSQCLSCDGI